MTAEHLLSLPADITCVWICICAAVIDVRSMRIPNRLTYSGVVLGLVLNFGIVCAYYGFAKGLTAGLVPSLIGCVLLFLVFGAMAAIGAMGMGDVKLMAAVGALLRWPWCLYALISVLIAGGVLSIGYAAARGQVRAVFSNIFSGKILYDRQPPSEPLQLHKIPYAAAILAGVTWAVLARYYYMMLPHIQ
jgi:prepilin peptidase CpaA